MKYLVGKYSSSGELRYLTDAGGYSKSTKKARRFDSRADALDVARTGDGGSVFSCVEAETAPGVVGYIFGAGRRS